MSKLGDLVERRPVTMVVGAVLVAAAFVIGCHVFKSAMEAAAYNRATGSNVSTWDAMWIELRVQAGPRD